jgi:hypothetical protein
MPIMKLGTPHSEVRLSSVQDADGTEFDGFSYNEKKKVDCICPKCGRKHVMAFHWIGRGIPRKYCPSCKGSYKD